PDLLGAQQSFVLLDVPVIGGLGSLPGAVAGAFFVYLPGYLLSPVLVHVFGSYGHQLGFQMALGGLGLIAATLSYPSGLGGAGRIAGNEVRDLGPELRAQFGLARSFQSADLFAGLIVRETIQLAMARTHRVGFLSAMSAAPWARATERATRTTAEEVIER